MALFLGKVRAMLPTREITPDSVLTLGAYAAIRNQKRLALLPLKQLRRVSIGPAATFHFECYETMWFQVHEMLFIEKGGPKQLLEELAAYNPLIPQGNELVATLMFEIDNPARRQKLLSQLHGIEETIYLKFGGETVQADPEQAVGNRDSSSKISSVQFFHFRLNPEQVKLFKQPEIQVVIEIGHDFYRHMAILLEPTRVELSRDLN
jgi:hypothetical protein